MTDIEAKALALMNKVMSEKGLAGDAKIFRCIPAQEALCRAIEQHEAFKQEVSDAVDKARYITVDGAHLEQFNIIMGDFIIPKPKPDPLVQAWIEATGNTVGMEPLNAALEARGLEIREKGQ
jgi:hypothetical protein